jgi:hypothetical protein
MYLSKAGRVISAEEKIQELLVENGELKSLLHWVYADGAGREIFPKDLCGEPYPEWQEIEKLFKPK